MRSFYRKLNETQSAIPSIFCAMVMQRNWCATSTRNNAAITIFQSQDWLHRNLIKSGFVFLSIGCFAQLCYIENVFLHFSLSREKETWLFFNFKDANLQSNSPHRPTYWLHLVWLNIFVSNTWIIIFYWQKFNVYWNNRVKNKRGIQFSRDKRKLYIQSSLLEYSKE